MGNENRNTLSINKPNDYDPHKTIAVRVIIKAIDDFRDAIKVLKSKKSSHNSKFKATQEIESIIKFFGGELALFYFNYIERKPLEVREILLQELADAKVELVYDLQENKAS